MQAIRQAESSASGQDQETDPRKSKKLKIPETEELQGRPSERPRRAVDWNGRGPAEQIHPGSQREVRSILIKKKQSHDENRQAEVQSGNLRETLLDEETLQSWRGKEPWPD